MTTPEAEYSASVDDGHLDTKRPLRGASERKKRPGKMPGSFFGKGLFRGREATPSSARITGGDAPSPPEGKIGKERTYTLLRNVVRPAGPKGADMAIYHFSAQVISRSSGGNAIAAAAYRAGEKIEKYDYSRKKGIAYSEILAPENAPEWAKNREKLWRTVEDSEKRKDSQLCREINVALPLELKTEERKALLKDFCTQFIRLGMVADIAMHQQDSGNPHAHIMLTMRELTPDGFGGKISPGASVVMTRRRSKRRGQGREAA